MKGKAHRYIIESDSDSDEFEDDDCNSEKVYSAQILNSGESQKGNADILKLSQSLKGVKLIDDDDDHDHDNDNESKNDDDDDDDNENSDIDGDIDSDNHSASDITSDEDDKKNGKRKPPPGKNLLSLEDLSWSTSDNDSDGSDSTVSSLRKDERKLSSMMPIRSIKNSRSSHSVLSSSCSFSNSNSSVIMSKNVKKYKQHIGRKNKSTKNYASSRVKRTYSSGSSSSSSCSSMSTTSSSDDNYPLILKKKSSKKKDYLWSFNKNRKEYTIGGNNKMPAFSVPSNLFNKLYGFQREGVAWMASLYEGKIGGILADDMGMGKTWMTLSLLGGLMKTKTIQKALVVAPVSVLRNWEKEATFILRNCVNLKVKIEVIASDISIQKRKKKLHQALEAQSPQLVITTFGLVSNNPDHFTQRVAGNRVWDYVVLDEAHKIKNPSTKISVNMKVIAHSAKTRRLILTGTPIMNNLNELHSLFTFATSGKILGTHKQFQANFGRPIEAARSAGAEDYEVQSGEKAMKELQQAIHPYFLQRTKSEYLSDALPPKNEYVLWTNLSPSQREKYFEYVQSENVSDYFNGVVKSPLLAITFLQKLCGHPLLVENESVDSIENFDEHDPNELIEASSKLGVLSDLVDRLIGKGHRTLIFSQSTTVLDIIERVLQGRFNLLRIDGKTKEKDRQNRVDIFNDQASDIDIMLISTKAGGQGLTLTGADTCIIYDPSWNPAEDSQAADRCYRIGQRKEVQVFRLITAGTVEEKRYEKQIHKDGLRRTLLTNTGNMTAKYFTKEELLRKKVFVLGDEGECEFLHKLKRRGFAYKENRNSDHSFTSLQGVVGQSSHDIVYSLPEDFYLDEMTTSPSQHPFSSPPTESMWLSKHPQPKIVGRSQAVLSKKTNVDDKENDIKDRTPKYKGKIQFINKKSDDPSPYKLPSTCSSTFLENTLSRAYNLRMSGKREEAVGLLMDLMDEKYGTLRKVDKLKVHDTFSSITNELGWLF